MIHVSVDGGEVWNMAQLPTVNHEQFYSILAANQDMIFMHVDDAGGQSKSDTEDVAARLIIMLVTQKNVCMLC